MPRLPADFLISLKRRGEKTVRIELVKQVIGDRCWVRRDGKSSRKVPEATATQVANLIRGWLATAG
jgi:hypothetical protein